MPVEEVAKLPLRNVLDRVEASISADGGIDPVRGAAFLGIAKAPKYRISEVLEDYWKLAEDKAQGKSQDQMRRMRNPRIKAFRNFIAVVGDLAVTELVQRDLIDFRAWWWDRIKAEVLDPASANKDFTHIASTFRLVDRSLQLGVTLNFTALNFTVLEKRTRLPFSRNWIATKILAPGVLDGLNIEARSILLGMINTGYRPSEAQDLLPQHIRLDDETPHISIEPVGRTLKTQASRRIIPLVGVSLEAFRACPEGFPRYRGGAALSATVNKYLRENGLLETPDHSMYGLRHSIEDRMLDADVDERIRRDVLGHSLSRERYGKGADLAKLAETLRKVAI